MKAWSTPSGKAKADEDDKRWEERLRKIAKHKLEKSE